MHDRIRTRRLTIQRTRVDKLSIELEMLTDMLTFANERADGSLSSATALCRELQRHVAQGSLTHHNYLCIARKFHEMLMAILAASPEAKKVLAESGPAKATHPRTRGPRDGR